MNIEKKTDIFELIHNRRSIRKFTNEPISDEILKEILLAGIRAPFAVQLCSIIYTRDKEKMRIKCGVYPTTNILMIFLVDFYKLERIVKERGYTYNFDDGMLLLLGIQDASLVAENIILAAEAFGLGSVLLGTVPLHIDRIQEIFKIPKRVFPLVGLCLGYPDPDVLFEIRPRYPLKSIAFEDVYKEPTESELKEMMRAMDEGYITQGYYIKQKAKIPFKDNREDPYDYDKYSWTEHISRKVIQGIWGNSSVLTILKNHGINL